MAHQGIAIIRVAFIKSLASERSRDFTFTALVPSVQIQTLTQTLTNTPNHIIDLDPNVIT